MILPLPVPPPPRQIGVGPSPFVPHIPGGGDTIALSVGRRGAGFVACPVGRASSVSTEAVSRCEPEPDVFITHSVAASLPPPWTLSLSIIHTIYFKI